MKSKMLISLFVLVFLTIKPEPVHAVVKFADERIEADIQRIYHRYPYIKKQFDLLSSSKLIYVIRYGELKKRCDARFETDGQNLFLTFSKQQTHLCALHICFAHEATHALQFERGQIGFIQNEDGDWGGINVDLWDETEAFKASLKVAGNWDLCGTNLGKFKKIYEKEGFEEAAKWLSSLYPRLSVERKNNPTESDFKFVTTVYIKRGYKFFGNAYEPS